MARRFAKVYIHHYSPAFRGIVVYYSLETCMKLNPKLAGGELADYFKM